MSDDEALDLVLQLQADGIEFKQCGYTLHAKTGADKIDSGLRTVIVRNWRVFALAVKTRRAAQHLLQQTAKKSRREITC